MARPQRNLTTDDRFHVINRGIDSQDLFAIDDDWVLFESLVGSACTEGDFQINAYVLMHNHYHLLVDLSDCDNRGAVADLIGVAQSTYSKYFNSRTGRRGPLFEPRFLSYGVDGAQRTERAVRYIHRNPIDICGRRALGNYRWSSLPVVLGRRPAPPWLSCELFEPDDPVSYLAELAEVEPEDLWPYEDLAPLHRLSYDHIRHVVAGLPSTIAKPATRHDIECFLALHLRAADVMDVAARREESSATVRNRASRTRSRRRDDPAFAQFLDTIVNELGRKNR
ncbi:MAG: transposase [Ilumatobacter sp.]